MFVTADIKAGFVDAMTYRILFAQVAEQFFYIRLVYERQYIPGFDIVVFEKRYQLIAGNRIAFDDNRKHHKCVA